MPFRHSTAALAAVAIAFFAATLPALAQSAPSPTPAAMPATVPTKSMKPAAVATPTPPPTPTPSPSPPPHLIQFSGYGDLGAEWVSTASALQFTNGGNARVFDYLPDQLNFNNLEVITTLNAGNLGGKADLSFGNDANIIASFGQPTSSDFNITQAYLTYQLGPVSLQAGKYDTLAGEEVISSALNYNYSRSILFGYAIPFTHTGVRATWAVTPHFSVIAGGNEGWDVLNSANHAITFEGELAWNPSSAMSLVADTYNGKSQVSYASLGTTGNRALYDVVGTIKPFAPLTLVLNYDYGSQQNAFPVDSTGAPLFYNCGTTADPLLCQVQATANWNGFAGYINYSLNSLWSGTLRGETFSDGQGYRTGYAQTWEEGTGTIQYSPGPFIFRAEYRVDRLNHPNFISTSGVGVGNLQTIGLEGIVKF